MNIRVKVLAALGLAALLAIPASSAAQGNVPDTAVQRPMRRGMMRQAGPAGGMQMGRGMRSGMMGGGYGPQFLIGLKDELQLSEEQVTQLEGIHESHHAQMSGMREQMQKGRQALQEARQADDFDAMERAIDDLAALRTAQAKSFVEVERQSLGVLSDAQRQKFETWKEGAQLFRRNGMRQRRMQMQGDGQGMPMRQRMHQPGGSR